MGTNKITPNVAKWLNDPSISKQDAHDAFGPDANVHDLTQAEMDTSTGVITTGGSSTQNGAARWVDPGGSNDATRVMEVYHSGLSRTVGLPKKHMDWASLPATGDIGEMVYVTDLQITVEYRDATADAVLSGTGLGGWHPIAGGLMLASNATGGDIEANRVVALVGTTGTRRAAKTTVEKQQNVLGVNLHSATIATGSNFIVALPGYGNPLKVRVDPTVTIEGGAALEITAGDWLCSTASTAGVARTAGPATSSGFPAANQFITGVAQGAFATSLEDRLSGAGAGTVMAKMLPAVGAGAWVRHDASLIWRDLTPTDADIFACRATAGNNGTQSAVNDVFVTEKHMPVTAVSLEAIFAGTMGAGGSVMGVEIGPSSGIVHGGVRIEGQGNTDTLGLRGMVETGTRSAASNTVIGNRFRVDTTSTNMSAVNNFDLLQVGYHF